MFKNSSYDRVAVMGAVALAIGGAGAAQAEAPRRAAAAPDMTLGAAAAPPVGFLDLCQRNSAACVAPGDALPDLAALRAEAMRRFWSDAFAQRSTAPAAVADVRFDWSAVFPAAPSRAAALPAASSSGVAPRVGSPRSWRTLAPAGGRAWTLVPSQGAPTAIDVAVTIDPEVENDIEGSNAATVSVSAGDAVNAINTQAGPMTAVAAAAGDQIFGAAGEKTVSAEDGEGTVAASAADGEGPAASAGRTFDLDRAGWRLVNTVNRRVNRSIRQTSDDRLYGVGDFWTLPTAGRGDCEDFVLAKREALIAEGVPAEALSIAIVETRWGESHAVLLIASNEGEYVLDSLSPWVSRWDRVDYAWRERQRPGRPFDWVTAAL